ncbi:Kri1 domain-containing protein [Phanerochaete sordida]|uniref:Kri1 domain-containing protein n=1 Tax=Phanerochaete sordida TaxID=48140 RepID=A0A9P3LJ95_9APHY|nr:Kri1 domain-containing protein [Phanerochaete sordida]
MKADILASDSEPEDIHELTINEHYAKAFEYRKEREELQKLKDKYGSDVDENADEEEDSEEAESEDEDGEELTPAVDAAILRTLARIKRKDPAIYQSGKDVFEEEVQKTAEAKLTVRGPKDKSKPLTIKQQNLQAALNPDSRSPSPEPITHVKEQAALRNETIAAFHTAVEAAESDDDLLVPREKTKDELEREEEEYQEYLQREVGTDLKELITIEEGASAFIADDAEESKSSKKRKDKKGKKESGKSKTEEDQEFLMNYILGRGWIDRDAKRLPTYKEITESKGKKGRGKARADSPMDEDDGEEEQRQSGSVADDEGADGVDEDEFDEVADRFESSYNFRFEEPGADHIPRYPRTLNETVRREESSRKAERERRKARKEEEMLKKKEEVKRLKALKMKEIRSKLERIGKEGGKHVDETEALQELDLDSDWDPEKHDNQMTKIYGMDEADDDFDAEKPTWDDDIDITDIVHEDSSSKKKKKKKKKKDEPEDDEGVDIDEMDADVVRDDEEWDGTEDMRKRKLDEYMDELYGLEFNDMVAGMPTRFRYTKVQPQAFALSPVEILLATDAELNQYMGLKKFAPYRKDGGGWDNNRTAKLKELKDKIRQRGHALGAGEDITKVLPEKPAKKRKGKKERMREKAAADLGVSLEEGAEEDQGAPEQEEKPKKESGKKRKVAEPQPALEEAADATAEPSSKRKRRRHKKSNQESQEA